MARTAHLGFAAAAALLLTAGAAAQATIRIDQPMSPPLWALLERQLLRENAAACQEFYETYFDQRGYLECVERWGGDDGPDDAIENLLHWPILHACGGDDRILATYKRAWEGHLRQYTEARTIDVPLATGGMYYKEFPVMFDWLHNSEGLTVFCHQGLSDPDDRGFRKRTRRFAGFYLNEDPQAPNYDPQHRIIRSLFNGSRGPLLRKATGLDWAGDPIEVQGRFRPGHGEENYEQMLAHFKDYNDIVGDHPSNLMATALRLNAYMLSHEEKYKRWVLEYVEAWRERMVGNGNLIPSNIGLDGKVGGGAGGKWYGGVYGWAFSVEVPQTGAIAHRQTVHLGINGFLNAVLLSGRPELLDPWRKQIDIVNSNRRVVDGRTLYPHKFGDEGWYDFTSEPFDDGAREIYYVTLTAEDRRLAGTNDWFDFLDGRRPEYPERMLRSDLARIRSRVAAMRSDETTPDTRLADDPLKFNPASVQSLVELTLGGLHPGKNSLVLHCRLRYFDDDRRRAGIPADVAALVDKLTDTETSVTLVNTSQTEPRRLTVQAGAYGEHQILRLRHGGQWHAVDAPRFSVQLAPGCGARLHLEMRRYANPPSLRMPW